MLQPPFRLFYQFELLLSYGLRGIERRLLTKIQPREVNVT